MRGLHLGLSLTGGTTVFTPTSLFSASPKGVWYDPSDLATLYQSGTRASPGTAVAADGDPVGLVLDKSGNNYDLVQATSTKRPLYKTSGGLSWLQFDGTDDALASSVAIDLTAYGQLGVAGAFTPSSTSSGMIAELGANVSGSNGLFYLAAVNDNAAGKISTGVETSALDDVATTATTFGSGVTSLISYQSMDITQAAATSKMPMRRNGATVAVGATADTGGAGTVFSSQTLNVGARGGTTVFLNGKIYGILIRGGAFTSGELAKVETWLGAKAGLTI